MPHYADSSFLVSRYLSDANTIAAHDYLDKITQPLIFTLLHALEVTSAFELAVFRKLMDRDGIIRANQVVADDLKTGRLIPTTIRWPGVLRLARKMSELHAATVGTRSLDVLHVAAAKTVKSDQFVTFDARQSRDGQGCWLGRCSIEIGKLIPRIA